MRERSIERERGMERWRWRWRCDRCDERDGTGRVGLACVALRCGEGWNEMGWDGMGSEHRHRDNSSSVEVSERVSG